MYQSLHTSAIGPQGARIEIQIRTHEMHKVAEEGIAAHWKYKEGGALQEADDKRFTWLRQLLEWQRDLKDQCVAAGVKIHFVKRHDDEWIRYMEGKWIEFPPCIDDWFEESADDWMYAVS
jgi:(p)ppGpp synthase/HD superfamily hydrolase